MKKGVILFLTVLACMGAFTAQAEEVNKTNAMDWHISIMPEQTAEEKEATRWSVVLENKLGIYAYDMSSLNYSQLVNGVPDKNIISVLTKTLFTDIETLKKLNEKYKANLKKKEKVQYCEIMMRFNLVDKTYCVESMDVYSNKKDLLQHTTKAINFLPVPVGSFAEAMLEICEKAAAEQEDEAAQ